MDVSKYAALFLAESREHLSSCNQQLLRWEREPGAAEPVGGLFRSIHTIKGMGATMGFTGVAVAVRRAEALGLVTQVRPPLVQLEREEFDGRLAFRIESPAGEEELAAVIRAAGEIESVRFEEPAAETIGVGRQRQIRVDLG